MNEDFEILKKMINKIKDLKYNLNESFNVNSLDSVDKSYYEDDLSDLASKVDSGIKITEYVVNRENENVVIVGVLSNGLIWSYDKNGGIQIGTPIGERFVDITKDDIPIIVKLINFYYVWKDKWNNRFREDPLLSKK